MLGVETLRTKTSGLVVEAVETSDATEVGGTRKASVAAMSVPVLAHQILEVGRLELVLVGENIAKVVHETLSSEFLCSQDLSLGVFRDGRNIGAVHLETIFVSDVCHRHRHTFGRGVRVGSSDSIGSQTLRLSSLLVGYAVLGLVREAVLSRAIILGAVVQDTSFRGQAGLQAVAVKLGASKSVASKLVGSKTTGSELACSSSCVLVGSELTGPSS